MMDVQCDESSMASSDNDSSSDLEYKTCGKIAQLVLIRLEYLVDGLDTLQKRAHQGEEYGCHSRSSPVQTDNWDAEGQDNSMLIAESQDHGQDSESMDDPEVSTHKLGQDQDIIEEKYKSQDNLNEHGQCSDNYSHYPFEIIVLKQEEVVVGGGGEKEEQNGEIVDEGQQVKKKDPLMHIESFSTHLSYRSTIELHAQELSKVEDLEGIEEGETNGKYHSPKMMQVQDFSPNLNTKIDNFKSENESNVMNTQRIGAEPIGDQESSTFNESVNKSYTCKYCNYETNKKFLLTKHLHTHTGERPNSCVFCDKTFNYKSYLNRHLLTHTGEKPYSCVFCDYKTAHKSHLNTHLRTHTGERPYSCEICDKTFSDKSHLNTHLHTHTGERPHSCEFCDKTFRHKSSLTSHLLTHTGEKPHSCVFCDYKTAYKTYLTTHLLTHTGEKPHSCEFCDKTFSHKSSLTSHLLTHTGEKPHSCVFCDFKTAHKSFLNKHMRRHTS